MPLVTANGTRGPLLIMAPTGITAPLSMSSSAQSEYFIAHSRSGWNTEDIMNKWMQQAFIPYVNRLRESSAAAGVAGSRRHLLLLDGHSSHTGCDIVSLAAANDIDLLVFPPHLTHLLQPLDTGGLAPFRNHLTTALQTCLQGQSIANMLQSGEMLKIIHESYQAMTVNVIRSSFRNSYVYPPPTTVRG